VHEPHTSSRQAASQTGGDVFRRATEPRDFKVVNRRRAVHRDVRDDAPAHEIDQEWREPGLDDMAAEHDDDAALAPCRADNRVDNAEKVARDKNVGQ